MTTISKTGKRSNCSKREALLAALRACGTEGGLTAALGPASGAQDTTVSTWLTRWSAEGVVRWWPDPIGTNWIRRRWWLAEFWPAVKPAPSGVPSRVTVLHATCDGVAIKGPARPVSRAPFMRGDGVLVAPGYTHDTRYQLAPGERVIGGFASMGIGRYLDEARP